MNVAKLITKKPYERVEYTLRRHPVTFLPTILLFAVLLGLPYILYTLIGGMFSDTLRDPRVMPPATLFAAAYYLSTYLFFYTHFVDYYLDLWIVTNDRIIDIEQQGVFSRTVTELDLFQIQDVTTQISGVMPTIFRYGNVVVKTASTTADIVFRNVPNPNKVREHILILANEDRKFHQRASSAGEAAHTFVL